MHLFLFTLENYPEIEVLKTYYVKFCLLLALYMKIFLNIRIILSSSHKRLCIIHCIFNGFYKTKNVCLQFFGKRPKSTLFNVQGSDVNHHN